MNKKLILACLLITGAVFLFWYSPPEESELRIAKYFLIVWVSGAIITTPLWCLLSGFRNDFFGPTSPQRSHFQRVRAFVVAMLPLFIRELFLWPFALRQALEFGLPPLLTKWGLRAEWKELSEGEKSAATWKTKDGREFSAGVSGIYARDPATISAEWPDGSVAFRLRRLAPGTGEFIDWRPMERMSMNDWAEVVETRAELNEPRPYDDEIILKRAGKFLVEFRVETRPEQSEEFSGVILIVT